MSATNQQMTREQLDELMVVAVSMQRDAEKLGERPVAVFAYAVQLALAELQKTRQQHAAVVAENAGLRDFVKTCFRAAADGASLDGADIQELGERLGLFGRETYQPALHGYICGHEAGEDTVYVMNKTPATDAAIANIQAQGVEMVIAAKKHQREIMHADTFGYGAAQESLRALINQLESFAAQLRQGAEHE